MKVTNTLIAIALSTIWPASFAQTPNSSAPVEFYFFIGAATWSDNLVIELIDGQIVCTKSDVRGSEEIFRKRPVEDEWKQFRNALDRSQIWLWRKNYINLKTYDGTRWEIRAKFADKKIVSNGLNLYPDARGKSNIWYEDGVQFQTFMNAVKKIVPDCGL